VLAAKEKTEPLGASLAQAKTRVWGLPPGTGNGISGCSPVTSTHVWGSWHAYAETASGGLVNRYYSNQYGRFITPDPAGQGAAVPQNPQSWNRYAYVTGDPVNRNDPHGLYGDEPDPDDDDDDDGGGNPCFGADEFTPSPSPYCQGGEDGGGGGGGNSGPVFYAETTATTGKNTAKFVLKHLNGALTKLTTFNTKAGGPCATDLTAVGLNAQDVRTMAGQALNGGIQIVNAATNLTALDAMQSLNADFGIYGNTSTIYYDTNFMWQSTMGLLMGTLIHEFSHVGTNGVPGLTDAMDQASLRITVGDVTTNISKKISADCFGYKGPIE
jgi:RHS repeat-associated protein